MKLYDKFFQVVKNFREIFSSGPVTNAEVSGTLTAEILLIVSLILVCLVIRHVNVLLCGFITLIVAVALIVNMPLIPKFKKEQDDSLNKMLFYSVLTLGAIIVFIYWGGNLV